MYQEKTEDMKQEGLSKKVFKAIKNVFDIRNIIIYIITFLVSGLALKGGLMPFGFAMVAACVSSAVPVAITLICAIVGTFLKVGIGETVKFLIITVIYLIFSLIFRSKVSREDRNEKIKTGSKLFWAYLMVSTVINFRIGFSMGTLFMDAVNGGIIYVFYKLFVNGMSLISNFGYKEAYSNEEISACSILFAIAFMRFAGINIFNMNLSTIFFIFIIIGAAWSRGKKVGLCTGVIIGLLAGLILDVDIRFVGILALIGFIAGFLKRINKFAFIIIVILANIIAYFAFSQNQELILVLREVLIASLGLIFVHEGIRLTDEDVFGKFKLLANGGEKRLNPSSKEIEDNIKEGFDLYEAIFNSSKENSKEEIELKERFVNDFLDSVEEIEKNMFYEEISKEESQIPYDIYKVVKENSLVVDKDVEAILNNNNIYIFMQDPKTKEDLQEIVKISNRTFKEIKNVAEKSNQKIENEKAEKRREEIKKELDSNKEVKEKNEEKTETTKKDNKTSEKKEEKIVEKNIEEKGTKKEDDKIFEKDEEEILKLLSEKNLEVENCSIKKLENKKLIIKFQKISKKSRLRDKDITASVADLLSKKFGVKIVFFREKEEQEGSYTQVYTTEDKYTIQIGNSEKTKEGNSYLVDNNIQVKLEDGKILFAIIDGKIENGEKAPEVSNSISKIIKKTFSEEKEIDKIKSSIDQGLNIGSDLSEKPSIDIAIIDLFLGNVNFLKYNGCVTYIKNKKNIKRIEFEPNLFESDKEKLEKEFYSFSDGDMLIMMSDGIQNSKESFGKDWVEEILRNASSNNAQKLSDMLLNEAMQNYYDIAQDDLTIIVAKIIKK